MTNKSINVVGGVVVLKDKITGYRKRLRLSVALGFGQLVAEGREYTYADISFKRRNRFKVKPVGGWLSIIGIMKDGNFYYALNAFTSTKGEYFPGFTILGKGEKEITTIEVVSFCLQLQNKTKLLPASKLEDVLLID